jgi:hypothetical protein
VAFHSPRQLAAKFVNECREIAFAGWGPDTAYAEWFSDVLAATQPYGLYAAIGGFDEPRDRLHTIMARAERVPLPPSGWATGRELSNHGKEADEQVR